MHFVKIPKIQRSEYFIKIIFFNFNRIVRLSTHVWTMKADFQIAAKLLAEAIQFKLAAR